MKLTKSFKMPDGSWRTVELTEEDIEEAVEDGIEVNRKILRKVKSETLEPEEENLIKEKLMVKGFTLLKSKLDSKAEKKRKENIPEATASQKSFLDDLGVDYDEDITKPEASKLIDQNK